MAGFPAYCKHCNSLFASRAFKISGNIRGLKLAGNTEPCPICQEQANLIDGTFDVTDEAMVLLSGPSITKDILRAFSGLVERAARKEIGTEELQKEATSLDPTLGDAVARVIKASPLALPILLMIILLLKACEFKVETKLDLNQLWDQLVSHGSGVAYTPSKIKPQDSKSDRKGTNPDTPGGSPNKK